MEHPPSPPQPCAAANSDKTIESLRRKLKAAQRSAALGLEWRRKSQGHERKMAAVMRQNEDLRKSLLRWRSKFSVELESRQSLARELARAEDRISELLFAGPDVLISKRKDGGEGKGEDLRVAEEVLDDLDFWQKVGCDGHIAEIISNHVSNFIALLRHPIKARRSSVMPRLRLTRSPWALLRQRLSPRPQITLKRTKALVGSESYLQRPPPHRL